MSVSRIRRRPDRPRGGHQGHSAQHVNDVGLAGAEDFVIWNQALGVDAIIVTKDEDFAERTARTAVGPGSHDTYLNILGKDAVLNVQRGAGRRRSPKEPSSTVCKMDLTTERSICLL